MNEFIYYKSQCPVCVHREARTLNLYWDQLIEKLVISLTSWFWSDVYIFDELYEKVCKPAEFLAKKKHGQEGDFL